MPTSPTYIANDQPTDKDALDFTPYVETLADIIQTGNTPLTIGVFGTWGTGKTSLMKMVKNQLPKDFTIAWFDAWKYDKEETLWRAFLLSVLTAVRSTIKEGQPTEDLEYLETMLYRNIEIEKAGGVTIDLAKLGGAVAKGGVQLALSFIPGGAVLSEFVKKVQALGAEALTDEATDAIQRERTKIQIEQVRFLEQFQVKFRHLVEQHVSNSGKRLVVFVDDLDRCLPEKAIEVLEAIKLFLDAENCIFVLGLDQEVIARGIEMKYKEFGAKQDDDGQGHFTIEGMRYLEKIIQLPFQIPPVEPTDMSNFVHGLSDQWPHDDCPTVFAVGLGDNPRQIKRTVNIFLMLWSLADKRRGRLQGQVKPIRLAKIVAIQAAYPDLYNLLLKDEPRYLRELEEYYQAEISASRTNEMLTSKLDSIASQIIKDSPKTQEETQGDISAKTLALLDRISVLQKEMQQDEIPSASGYSESQFKTKKELAPALVPFMSRRGASAVQRILTLHNPEIKDANFAGLPPDELKLYFTLTRRAEAPQPTPMPEAVRLVFEPQMVKIPAGKFLMGTTAEQAQAVLKETNNDKDWQKWLDWEQPQHTVELSEYSIGKYPITNREYQAFIKDTNYKPPQGWDGDQFPNEKGGHPVVNVSWEDASAYCEWLSEKTKKTYRLPSEAEWEKAARWLIRPDSRESRWYEEALIFPWGNTFNSKKANILESGIGDTSEVGQFSPQGDSPFGCVDMAGNVWEWCMDWFEKDTYKNRKGVKDPQSEPLRNPQVIHVIRGGSFKYPSWYARCSCRIDGPDGTNSDIGFRIVLSSAHQPISRISISAREHYGEEFTRE